MTTYIQTDHFTNPLRTLLDETFDNVRGAYLDKGSSLFETLAPISAERLRCRRAAGAPHWPPR